MGGAGAGGEAAGRGQASCWTDAGAAPAAAAPPCGWGLRGRPLLGVSTSAHGLPGPAAGRPAGVPCVSAGVHGAAGTRSGVPLAVVFNRRQEWLCL